MKLTIPFYLHKVGAGFPSPATDYIEDDIDLNSHLITNAPATFIIGYIAANSQVINWVNLRLEIKVNN